MKKILFLSNMGPSIEKPNSGRFVANQFEAIKNKAIFDIDYFYLDQDDKKGGLKALRYPQFFGRFLIKKILTRNQVDLIHIHFYFPTILLAVVYKLIRNPKVQIVVTFHGSDVYKYEHPNVFYKLLSNFVSHYIFVSKELRNKFYKKVSADVLSAGVLDTFYDSKTKNTYEYDLIFVGHMDFNKGSDRLIHLINTCPELKIAIIGEGEYLSQLEALKSKNISIFGGVNPNQLKEIYLQSRFLINLSRNESFGLVMTEAMACGLPVIATTTDGSLEQIENNQNGFLLPNDDAWLLANISNQILDILSAPVQTYSGLCNEAKKSSQKHKLSNIAECLIMLYNKLLSV